MSYFQHPHYIAIEGDTLSWNTMLNENSYNNICPGSMQVSRLLTEIGILSNANFGETTSTTINNVRNTICSFGYTCSEVSDFDATNIRSSLLSQHLVYARGGDLYSGNGHAWVIDGFIYQTMQTTYYSLNPPYHVVGGSVEERNYYRCNWGWYGISNGYFLDVFNVDSNTQFSQDKSIIYDIYPNI